MLLYIGVSILFIALFPYFCYLIGIRFGRKLTSISAITQYPCISIVIPAYNEENVIEKRIVNIAQSSYPKDRIEVILIDDCSADTTASLAKKTLDGCQISNKVLLNDERMGTNKSFNRGMAHAHHDLIVTTGADVFFEKDALKRIISRLVSEDNIAAVCADMQPTSASLSVIPGTMEKVYRNYYGLMCAWESAHDSTYNFNGGLVAFQRSVIDRIEEKRGADDANTAFEAIRQGYRAIYEIDAVVYEEIPGQSGQQYRQKVRRATRLLEATLSNLDLIALKRPFSRIFYPMRIWMFILSPILFFIGSIAIFGWIYTQNLTIFALFLTIMMLMLIFKKNILPSVFIFNQWYLLIGLFGIRKAKRIWESTSKKG